MKNFPRYNVDDKIHLIPEPAKKNYTAAGKKGAQNRNITIISTSIPTALYSIKLVPHWNKVRTWKAFHGNSIMWQNTFSQTS